MRNLISAVQRSNLFTMGCASKIDERQTVPEKRSMPDEAIRLLRARLILEEALETIHALGLSLESGKTEGVELDSVDSFIFHSDPMPEQHTVRVPNLEEIIDGCCDTIYVAVGTLCALGVPDLPHLLEVCRANNTKFLNGEAVMHPTIPGKFGKPEGWTSPCHDAEIGYPKGFNLAIVQKNVIETMGLKDQDDPKSEGEIAYNAYYEQAEGRSLVTGDRLPKWSVLKAPIKAAWGAVYNAVVHQVMTQEV